MATYAQQHSAFVSNLNGTTFSDIMLVSLPLPLCTLLVPTLLPLLCPPLFWGTGRLPWRAVVRLAAVLEFSVLVLPMVAAVTVLADHAAQLCTFLAAVAALATCVAASRCRRRLPLLTALRRATVAAPRLPCITNARAHLLLATVVAVLAVDFPVFPRRLAKAETFGAGLMDMAVGCYVISHGMTSPEARAAAGRRQPLRQRLATYAGTARGALLLAALGGARLALVKLTGYHEHESEYGRHWNFFFTLAAVRALASGWLLAVPARLAAPAALLLTLLQQHLLDAGLQTWVTDEAPRDSLLEANREAVASLIGFLALFFVGVAVGGHLMSPRRGWLRWLACWAQLTLAAAALWRLAAGMHGSTHPVSRRLANATYVVASAACCLSTLAAYLLADLATSLLHALDVVPAAVRVPRLMAAASQHGLQLFCAANVATGVVNLTYRTIEAGPAAALAVLVVYMAALSALVVWLSTRRPPPTSKED